MEDVPKCWAARLKYSDSQAEAEAWLERPAMALERRKPIDLLSTPAGVETVRRASNSNRGLGVYT